MTRLDDATAALRGATGDADDPLATRDRVLASVARRGAARRQLLALTTVAAILLSTGAVGWAWRTGRIERAVSAARGDLPLLAPAPPAPAVPPVSGTPAVPPVSGAPAVPPVSGTPAVPPVSGPAAAPAVPPVSGTVSGTPAVPPVSGTPAVPAVSGPAAGPAVPPVSGKRRGAAERYRRAHELHFRGGDAAAAVAAWDAYLASAGDDALVLEARYNRAIALVRAGRLDEARDALAPFAAGAVTPAGYRQREAAALLERIAERAR